MSIVTPIPPPPSLADHAFATLKREILACRLAPGEAVSETLVTERFRLGRAAVRAALARLAEEGLVHAVPRRGWMVSVVTVRDIHEVFQLRLMLEPEAAAAAAGHADLARLRQLDDICARGHRPDDADTALDFLEANRGFHVAVAELAGNQRLARQVGRLLDEATRMLVLGLSTRDRSGEMAHEHRDLIAAMIAHDPPRARQIMHDQIAASRDMVLAALTGPRSTLVVSDLP
jgi:DNA-binding GntR family transcriptional regulator